MEEDDIDEMLLSVTQKKKETAVESDDSSVRVYEGDEASDEDGENLDELEMVAHDGDSDFERGSARRKPKKDAGKRKRGSGRKRANDEDMDWKGDGGNATESSEYKDQYDENLYGDDEDRERLTNMSVKDREMVLADRFETRQRKKSEWDLRRRLRRQEGKPKKERRLQRSEERSRGNRDSQKSALDRLAADKARRENKRSGDDRGWKASTKGPPVTYADLVSVETRTTTPAFVRRDALAKWIEEAYFDRLVKGLFVKLSVGENPGAPGVQVYRVCRIESVIEVPISSRVQFGSHFTNKRLKLSFGTLKKPFDMTMLSNRSPTEQEFDRWVKQMEGDGEPLPSKAEIEQKVQQVRSTLKGEDRPSEEEIRKHQENYEKVNPESINRVAKKKELSMRIETAKSKNDDATVAELSSRLRLIEEVDEKIRTKSERRKAELTVTNTSALLRLKATKNKAENDRKDQIAAIRRTKAGDQSQNVFERLETAGQSYFSIKKTKSPAPTLKEPEKDLRGNALDLSLDQKDSAAIATEDGSKRPPISKRFDLSKIDTTLFDELLPIEIRPSRKYVPVPLDQKVILRRETREPRNSVSLEEFLKKPL
eukprot:CAMPEP_0113959572 /NCGR_PEP_ID=MMETSP0011_2-20120614/4224_1 /TAXON_ID=101924 /ORGANISM="Rhodosorus marinus" /LENGTH=596 /DNA_ID=CAMNT_0000970909 /DNA_START=568 /DNA_END=2358 /DNA_ORIENTATION=- /assembly_acc=CAM_ASM_000156